MLEETLNKSKNKKGNLIKAKSFFKTVWYLLVISAFSSGITILFLGNCSSLDNLTKASEMSKSINEMASVSSVLAKCLEANTGTDKQRSGANLRNCDDALKTYQYFVCHALMKMQVEKKVITLDHENKKATEKIIMVYDTNTENHLKRVERCTKTIKLL